MRRGSSKPGESCSLLKLRNMSLIERTEALMADFMPLLGWRWSIGRPSTRRLEQTGASAIGDRQTCAKLFLKTAHALSGSTSRPLVCNFVPYGSAH